MKTFKDQVAVVTGAESGIGRGMVETFVEEGIKVVLADIEEENLNQTRCRLPLSLHKKRSFLEKPMAYGWKGECPQKKWVVWYWMLSKRKSFLSLRMILMILLKDE